MIEFLIVGVGGFIGSCLRFGLTKLTAGLPFTVPAGTLLSNVTAGLFIGFIIGLEQQSVGIPPRTKLFLTTGLLGGLSTFSTFSMETISLFQDGKWLFAAGNIALNLALSLAAAALGLFIAKLLQGAQTV
jgi:CrcB protein